MKACSANQMRSIDKSAEELGSIPSVVLMENAALACVNEIIKDDTVSSVAIFSGKGNNGGDGFAIAKHLFNKGYYVEVFLVCSSEFKGDALINFEIISKMGIKITELYDTDLLELKISSFDLVVDAIFGTGIKGEITGFNYDIIKLINENAKKILSVDIPSGINADTGEICSICINADITVTFAAYKLGLILYPGAAHTGKIVFSDISIPEYIIKEQNINIDISDDKLISSIMPKRTDDSHKGDYGKILIIGGSVGLSGAVSMAADACVRSGAGLVTVAAPDCINDILEVKLTEPMTLPLPSDNGMLALSATDIIKEKINDFDVCLFGPGIGRSDNIPIILKELLCVSEIPVIIDADGLYALSKDISMLDECKSSLILTPHEMEMARLISKDLSYVKNNRISVSSEFASNFGVTLILKGPHTIVTSPAGEQYININGNNGMATGGSGDVLAGIIAAFSARDITETEASIISVFIHGLAGDIGAKHTCRDSLLPTDIISNIPLAIREFSENPM